MSAFPVMALGIGGKLFGVARGIASRISLTQAAMIGLIGYAGFATWRWHVDAGKVTTIVKLQKQAVRVATVTKTRVEIHYIHIKDQADARTKVALVSAQQRVTAYERLHPASLQHDLPCPANATAAPAQAVDAAVVSNADLDRLTTGFVIAQQWQDWWRQVGAVNRDVTPQDAKDTSP